MDNGAIVQLLIVAVIFIFGIWNVLQKGKKGTSGSPHRMQGGENFPFPASVSDPVPEAEVQPGQPAMVEERKSAEGAASDSFAVESRPIDRPPEEPASFLDSYVSREEEWVTIPHSEGKSEAPPEKTVHAAEHPKVVTDLRTIIISSELLKPKYQEY